MNDLRIFENEKFGKVRTIEQDGKVWFCGNDVAKALGYGINPQDAMRRHCKNDGCVNHAVTDNLGRLQNAKFINEGNLYRLILSSKLLSAEQFECWVFDEVLPSIRNHGKFVVDDLLNDPDMAIKAFTALKEERDKNKSLGVHNAQLQQKVLEYEPKVQYIDKILTSTGTLDTTQIALDYGLSARQLNNILHEEEIQWNVNGQWILYKEHMGLGYTKSDTIHFNRTDGIPDTKIQTKWTQKGRLLIHNILEKRGIKANIDIESGN